MPPDANAQLAAEVRSLRAIVVELRDKVRRLEVSAPQAGAVVGFANTAAVPAGWTTTTAPTTYIVKN